MIHFRYRTQRLCSGDQKVRFCQPVQSRLNCSTFDVSLGIQTAGKLLLVHEQTTEMSQRGAAVWSGNDTSSPMCWRNADSIAQLLRCYTCALHILSYPLILYYIDGYILRRIGRSLHCRMHKNTLALTVCALVATFFLPKASRMYTNGVDILSSYDLAWRSVKVRSLSFVYQRCILYSRVSSGGFVVVFVIRTSGARFYTHSTYACLHRVHCRRTAVA